VSYEVLIELEPAEAGDVDEDVVDALHAVCIDLLAAEDADPTTELTIVLSGDHRLRVLNREHRGVDSATDVLSFPADEGEPMPGVILEDETMRTHYLGDIAISVPTARRQAAEAGLSLEDELSHLVIHGLLHLLGYDHETDEEEAAMRALEEAVLGTQIHASGAHPHEA